MITKKSQSNKYKTFGKSRAVRLSGIRYDDKFTYFVTIRTTNGKPIFANPSIAEETFLLFKEKYLISELTTYAFVIMPNHIHWLLGLNVEDEKLSRVIATFKGRSATLLREKHGEINLWQRSFYDHIVRKEENITDIAEYIYENPIRKNLAKNEKVYPYSYINYNLLY